MSRVGKKFSGLRGIQYGQIERILILKDLFYLNFGFESRFTSNSRRFKKSQISRCYRPTPLRWNLVLKIQGAP
jgi:hypothetical protein